VPLVKSEGAGERIDQNAIVECKSKSPKKKTSADVVD
jgi:hypothetical protein